MSFYGIVGLIVYMLPAEYASSSQKIVVIVLVLLTMPFALLIGYVVSRRAKKKAAKELAAAGGGEVAVVDGQPAKAAAPTSAPTNDDLVKSTEEVIQFLKASNLGEAGKDAVYSLPWYIVAGTPKSGKSSLVLGSNLNFQTLPSQRQSEQKILRPTSSVEWRVTSEAVFADTAGRYQGEGVDAEEWASLLDTVRKHRSNRPLDGFLLVVDAEKILNGDERQVEEMAKLPCGCGWMTRSSGSRSSSLFTSYSRTRM